MLARFSGHLFAFPAPSNLSHSDTSKNDYIHHFLRVHYFKGRSRRLEIDQLPRMGGHHACILHS
jgi:hypothetical protein